MQKNLNKSINSNVFRQTNLDKSINSNVFRQANLDKSNKAKNLNNQLILTYLVRKI